MLMEFLSNLNVKLPLLERKTPIDDFLATVLLTPLLEILLEKAIQSRRFS